FVFTCERLKVVSRGYGIGAQPAERSSATQQDRVLRYIRVVRYTDFQSAAVPDFGGYTNI
ncbi:MAG TPA: hypothetical protein VK615_00535, partial [Candidatus Binatia bacterium]|nr:hypothetical protein [Candidatus Binatia bacterium]